MKALLTLAASVESGQLNVATPSTMIAMERLMTVTYAVQTKYASKVSVVKNVSPNALTQSYVVTVIKSSAYPLV